MSVKRNESCHGQPLNKSVATAQGIRPMSTSINLPSSKLQAKIASDLEIVRKLLLQEALGATVRDLDLSGINAQLDELVSADDLADLASRGIRGEYLFATPIVLRACPKLLGYYRLLLGFSQKEFYNKGKLSRFEVMEAKGEVPARISAEVDQLCKAMVQCASQMAHEIGFQRITLALLDDLTLLTLGPQLRGSNNTRIGKLANKAVFEIIQSIVAHAIRSTNSARLELLNASNRKVVIAFSSDPDISVEEEISAKTMKRIVAIEIKGGADKSNIWNRLGEAEKSHQSAKQRGFVEFWTIYNVPSLDLDKASEKSPSTTRFYSLMELARHTSAQYEDFRDRLVSLVGIKAQRRFRRKVV
jgi:hypothetical protein